MAEPRSHYRCPNCGKGSGFSFTVDVVAWQATDSRLQVRGQREVYWETAQPDGFWHCGECQWEGRKDDLVELGIDGEPLDRPGPDQVEIKQAARLPVDDEGNHGYTWS